MHGVVHSGPVNVLSSHRAVSFTHVPLMKQIPGQLAQEILQKSP